MKTILIFSLALLCSATAYAQQAPPQQWGTILGRIVYDGTPPKPAMMPTNGKTGPDGPKEIADESLIVGKHGGLANVFVFLRSKPSVIHPGYTKSEPQKILFEVKDYRYVPHALIIWTHDIVDFRNREPYGVNLNYTSSNQGTGALLPRGGDYEWRLRVSEKLPKPIGCNIHPWMHANLLVRDNPYFCVTDERGIFCIPNLPAGEEHEFQFWHERVGYLKNIKSDVAAFTTNDKGRLQTKLAPPVTDFGEFRIDPALVQGKE
jgi:hypothetical protein